MLKKLIKKNKAQIWIETVIYTLIGLVLIGMVLAVAKPAIEKQKDQKIIEYTITELNELDEKIDEVKIGGTGNARAYNFIVKKGSLIIDPENDTIEFVIPDSTYAASEEESNRIVSIPTSNLKIRTQKLGKGYKISIWRDYSPSNINITYNGKEDKKTFSIAPTAYSLMIENAGRAGQDSFLNINTYES